MNHIGFKSRLDSHLQIESILPLLEFDLKLDIHVISSIFVLYLKTKNFDIKAKWTWETAQSDSHHR